MGTLWDLWEAGVRRLAGIHPAGPDALVGLALRRYHGRHLTTVDGNCIAPGDYVAEIHMDNRRLRELVGGIATPQRRVPVLLQEINSSLRLVAQLVETDPVFGQVTGLYGVTLLHRGVGAVGLQVTDLPTGLRRWTVTRYLSALTAAYHPDGLRPTRRPETRVPKVVFMSRQLLVTRYGSAHSTTA